MRIGELAERSRVRPSALRYYEQRGLLLPPGRDAAGYRSYDDEAVRRLEFIDRARAAGLTLAQTVDILCIRDDGVAPCVHVQALLDQRLVEVDAQLKQLQALRQNILELRARAASAEPDACDVATICDYL